MLSTGVFSRPRELKNVQLWVKLSPHHCHVLVSMGFQTFLSAERL